MGNIYLDYSYRVGEKYITNEGYEIEIIEYKSKKDCIAKIGEVILSNLQYSHIKNGNIKNPYHPSVQGTGFIGQGLYKSKVSNKNTVLYNKWTGMFERCYSKKYQEKYPSYKGCTVAEEWHNFQNFAKWFEDNYNPETIQGWHLDKDILVKGNKIYSPETCCFVPSEVNTIFTKTNAKRGILPVGVSLRLSGRFQSSLLKCNKNVHLGTFDTPEEAFQAYKIEKEKYIKEVADKWKDLIDPKVYQAMYNYEVEITD